MTKKSKKVIFTLAAITAIAYCALVTYSFFTIIKNTYSGKPNYTEERAE